MASPNSARVRSIYRALLRELPPRPILSSPPSPLHQRLRDRFRSAPSTAQQTSGDAAIAEAEQIIAYLRAQRVYSTLLERYNPGMNMDEEERVRLTARRIGVDLPKEYQS